MTTPRDAAVEMVSEMIYRRVVTPILGGSDWEHEPKSENRIQCDELASRILAALASSPAPETTLAELVDAYDEAKANQTIAYNNWRNGQGQTIFADNLERTQAVTKEKRQALLAYQPPAPVSRAGAVEIDSDEVEAGAKALFVRYAKRDGVTDFEAVWDAKDSFGATIRSDYRRDALTVLRAALAAAEGRA